LNSGSVVGNVTELAQRLGQDSVLLPVCYDSLIGQLECLPSEHLGVSNVLTCGTPRRIETNPRHDYYDSTGNAEAQNCLVPVADFPVADFHVPTLIRISFHLISRLCFAAGEGKHLGA
jgi:hypothetical protein